MIYRHDPMDYGVGGGGRICRKKQKALYKGSQKIHKTDTKRVELTQREHWLYWLDDGGWSGGWAGGCWGIKQGWTGWMLHLASQRQSHGQLTCTLGRPTGQSL